MRTPQDLPNTDIADANYVHGKLRNDTLIGSGDGTPIRADWQSDLLYGHLEVLDRAGITPNHTAETSTSNQFADAVEQIARDQNTNKQLLSEKGQPLGYASLDAGGKIPTTELPSLAITDTFPVASEIAMLSLSAQKGDVAVRSDLNKSFILSAEPASTLANWVELFTPTDAVQSVNGMTGVVTLNISNIPNLTNSLEVLNDFRVWDGSRTYVTNDPVFFEGEPYKPNSLDMPTAGQSPATHPAKWTKTGGGGSVIGNISPDPDGSKGAVGWNGTVATIANGLTGFDTELAITANSVWTIPVPTQLHGEALELNFEAFVNAGTGIAVKMYSDSGATVEIPMTQTGLNATGKTQFIGKFWAVGANVYLKVAGTAFDLRITNIYVGRPESIEGAVISEWQAYTPTFQGFGTPTAVAFKYRRNGSNLEVKGKFTTGTTTAIEARIGLPSPYTSRSDVPTLELVGACATSPNQSQVSSILSEPSVSYLTLGVFNASGLSPLAKLLGNAYASSISLSFTATIPCAQFTSSMTIVGMNEPFFLSNTSFTSNADQGTAGTYNGEEGAPINTLVATSAKNCDLLLQRTIGPTEVPVLEFRTKIDGTWVVAEQASSTNARTLGTMYDSAGGSVNYGARLKKVTANQLRVNFGQYATINFAGTSTTWATIAGDTDGFDRWRVRISRGGEAWAVPPVVYAEYKAPSGIVSGGFIGSTQKVEDAYSGFNASNEWIIPMNGLYTVSGESFKSTTPSGAGTSVFVNGVVVGYAVNFITVAGYSLSVPISTTFRANKNDKLKIQNTSDTSSSCRYTITRIGS